MTDSKWIHELAENRELVRKLLAATRNLLEVVNGCSELLKEHDLTDVICKEAEQAVADAEKAGYRL